MNLLLFTSCQPGQQPTGGSPFATLLPFLLIILVFYFLLIRPQSKKQKEKQKMLRELKQGDEVITIGGIYGKIEGIRDKDNSLILRIAKDVKINVSRSAIADKVSGRETSF